MISMYKTFILYDYKNHTASSYVIAENQQRSLLTFFIPLLLFRWLLQVLQYVTQGCLFAPAILCL